MRKVKQAKGRSAIGRLAPVCLLSCSLFALAGAPDAELEIRHHNWWNYYQRGLVFTARGDYQAAREDFEVALGIRRGAKFGYDEELWRVRTYGMHFLEGYFPSRELGVAFYELGQTDQAIEYLERSMAKMPSGRARHYLNLARRRALEGQVVPPLRVDLDLPAEPKWTRERQWPLTGVVRGAGRVQRVSVNGNPQFIELAEASYGLHVNVPLRQGINNIRLEAEDLLGQVTTEEVELRADWAPPQLVIVGLDREGDGWRVRGKCTDDSGLKTVMVNGRELLDASSDFATRTCPLQVTAEPAVGLLVVAEDLAGNRLQQSVDTAALHEALHRAQRYAAAGEAGVADVGTPGVSGQTFEDQLKPSLRISAGTRVQVYDEEFFLDGQAQDGGGLAQITVNGENLLPGEDRGALQTYFSRRLPVDEGPNTFEVVARDTSGNETRRTFEVVRSIPDYLDEEYRLTVGIPPLAEADERIQTYDIKLALEEEILREPVRFHLLERDEGWDYILQEQNLSLSDLADPRAALRIGKMLPAQLLLLGGARAQGEGVTVYLKVVEASDARLLFVEDVYSEDRERDLPFKLGGLIMKIEQRFPLVKGQVVAADGGNVTIDVGARDGVKSGMPFVVIAPGAQGNPLDSGRVRHMEESLVELVAHRVRGDRTVARVLPGPAGSEVQAGDFAHAR